MYHKDSKQNKANLSEKTRRMVMPTMNEHIKKEISTGKDPMGLAATTVLYLSCLTNGETTTERDVVYAAGVTDVTVRNRLNDLKNRLHLN
jgi:transcription initiation factor TFIIB